MSQVNIESKIYEMLVHSHNKLEALKDKLCKVTELNKESIDFILSDSEFTYNKDQIIININK